MTFSWKKSETDAAQFLQTMGYHILEKNFRCLYGEIDIIAEHQGILCFIEVKSRSSSFFGFPSEAVHIVKQRHIIKVADYYLLQRYDRHKPACRFDVVSILSGCRPELIQNAFQKRY